jgi:UDP-N-acetylmuramoyl-tripeptide--D-alanyl-D-alanine ligase
MGANHPGEIATLAAISRPDVGVVTNASAAHLEGFGSIDGVARAKGEMFSSLPADGTAIVNADSPYADLWRGLCGDRRILTFGIDAVADVRAVGIDSRSPSGTGFRLVAPDGEIALQLPLPGLHNVMNALAAAAATLAVGASLDDVRAGLESAHAIPGRLRVARAVKGATLIDDCYNANPASLRAGIDYLCGLDGEPWLVFGDMGELGDDREAIHREAGRVAREAGVVRLFAVGDLARLAAGSFGANAEWFEDAATLSARLQSELHAGVSVLVKASRSMKLETVVRAIEEDGPDMTAVGG